MTSFTVDTKIFQNALASVYPIVPNKPSRDVLKGVKIIAKTGNPDTLELLVTDLETYAKAAIKTDVIVQTPGEFVAPAQVLFEYVKSLSEQNIELRITPEESIKVNESGTEFEVGIKDVDEFPEFPKIPDNLNWIDLPSADVALALSRVVFAVADKGHPRWGALSAICLDFSEDKITLIGTDQHRASLADIIVDTKISDKQFLVSAKALALLPKVLTGNLKVSVDNKNAVILTDGNNYLFVRLMHGNYPAVRKFVPKKHPNKLLIETNLLLHQVRKAALATDQHGLLRISLKKDKLLLAAKTREQRRVAKIEQDIVYSGPEAEFAFNCKYLLDLLKAADNNEELEIQFNKSNHPVLFKQTDFKHVMVPMEIR